MCVFTLYVSVYMYACNYISASVYACMCVRMGVRMYVSFRILNSDDILRYWLLSTFIIIQLTPASTLKT